MPTGHLLPALRLVDLPGVRWPDDLLAAAGAYDDDLPFACSAGVLGGNGSITVEQTSATCAGFCPAGSYCPTEATTEPTACPAGSYCELGSSAALPCREGTYSNATMLSSRDACTSCPEGSTSAMKCPESHFCPSPALQLPCSTPGAYCPGPQIRTDQQALTEGKCPAGSYCPDAKTAIPCGEGSYCPEMSVAETACAVGHFCATPAVQERCRDKTFCPQGSTEPLPCPKNGGSFLDGAIPVCDAGYFGVTDVFDVREVFEIRQS